MKKRLFYRTALTLTALSCIPTVCMAGMSLSGENGIYTLKGEGESARGNTVWIEVKSGEDTIHSSYAPIAKDGTISYSFEFPQNAPSDTSYVLNVSKSGEGTVFTDEFRFADTVKWETLVEALNSAKTAAAAEAAINDCFDYKVLSRPNTFEFTDGALKEIYAMTAKADGFTSENVTERMEGIFAICALKKPKSGTSVNIVSEYSEILGLDTEKYYDMYLATENKAGICDLFAYNSFDSIAELKKVFNEITVINQINIQQSHGGKKEVIAQCAELLPQSVTGLSDSKMTSLALKLMSKTVHSMTELDEIAKSIKSESGNSGNSSSGGGGGGSSSGGSGKYFGEVEVNNGATPNNITQRFKFIDMNEADWAADAVGALADKKIVNGYENGDFRPNSPITREEFVKIAVCAFGLEETAADCGFDDVTSAHWAYGYIGSAHQNGIVNGISQNSFGIGMNITRQDMAVIIDGFLRYVGSAPSGSQKEFADGASIADYAKTAVDALCGAGIISGYEDGTFAPNENASRAEAAQMIYNALKYAKRL